MKGSKDIVSKIIKCCQNREDILAKDGSMRKYNQYFDKMRKLARELLDANRQDELLPYLNSESVSIRRDIAGILYNSYPELCENTFREISEMTVATGLPKCFVIVVATAIATLKYGIPKDFP